MQNTPFSRRRFLGSMLSLAGTTAAPFALNLAAMGNAAAQSAGDYKAMVCLFMAGGNDAFNTVLATDPTSWAEYTRLRNTGGGDSIHLPDVGQTGGVLPIVPATAQTGRAFALHPQLAPLKGLFDNGRAAIVANVGTLIQPATLAQYKAGSVALPPKLFSHNDQQSTWQSGSPEGATVGWGGRVADVAGSLNTNAMFTAISAAGNTVFLSGRQVRQFQVGQAGAVPIRGMSGSLYGSTGGAGALQAIINEAGSDLIEQEHVAVVQRAISSQSVLSGAMLAAGTGGVPNPPPYINPNTGASGVNPLAVQLQTVARIIGGRGALGAKRQVFYVTLGSFDTHDRQKVLHGDLMARLAHALAYFDTTLAALQGVDLRRQVTTFTASDFGRTFSSNGDGTDHGWGAHHFVVGGAVKGRDIYGAFPVTGVGHALDVGSGALLPTTSVDQYGATLAKWFGVADSQLAEVFPNIGNFSRRDLGFMTVT
ncbi:MULTISPECIES: DUF1501 domain-containing protein [Janthinobacterium]|uniref:DUF1501 domain-containing protein n=1 Tax=Janthinobacterium aestuarii TaxID=2985511 RepID=A0ABZ2GJS7_9BURK|nr:MULTISPECIES: DUF1501 domain-containing protein [Janthinobacterium]EZP36657.1 hypothetical protein BW37_04111 [Janthinobacterium lividum]MBW3501645.1 DUF1501 domain-containing protein [Janthinobacterium sp. NKUCC08_JDC]